MIVQIFLHLFLREVWNTEQLMVTDRCYHPIYMYLLLTIVELGSIPTLFVSYKGYLIKDHQYTV